MINKSKSAFRTIAEVADEIGVATHVLRFWETKFSQIKPMKMSGGRRYYRPEDVEVIKLIAENSIEERVVNLQNEKKELVDKVINDEFK